MNLTAHNSHETFMKCLFKDGEPTDGYKEAHGVMMRVGFHPGRLEENKENIYSMLAGLPNEFKKSGGGGWTFLNACQDKNGVQWADLHSTIDELLCLGLAIDAVKFQLPREMWSVLPGGVPYFSVEIPEVQVSDTTEAK